MEVELGSKIKDEVTGFKGIATARCEYMNGCIQYEITPTQLKDGVPQKVYWIDKQRIILLIKKESSEKKRPGGPANHPTKKDPPTLAGYEKEEMNG